MINHSLTRIENSRPMPLHSEYLNQPGVSHIVEGMAMINSLENGIGRVRPSTGTAAHGSFLGLSAEINRRQTQAIAVEQHVVPSGSPYNVDLRNDALGTSAANQISVRRTAGGTVENLIVAATAPSATDEVQWVDTDRDRLVFHSADAGDTVLVIYRYSPTLEQAVVLFGDGNVLGRASPGDAAQVMTVITHGLIFTDQFDPADDWFAADITDVHSKANGLLGRTGGEAVPGSRIQVVQAPSITVPFLGLLLL